MLLVVFGYLHLSYGSGFLAGLIRFYKHWGDKQGLVPTWEDVEARIQQEV